MCSCQDRMSDDFDQRHHPLSTPIPHLYKPRKWELGVWKGCLCFDTAANLNTLILSTPLITGRQPPFFVLYSWPIDGPNEHEALTLSQHNRHWTYIKPQLGQRLSYLGWRTWKSADQNHDWLLYWLIDWIIYLLIYGLTTLNEPKPRENYHTKYFQCGRFNL